MMAAVMGTFLVIILIIVIFLTDKPFWKKECFHAVNQNDKCR